MKKLLISIMCMVNLFASAQGIIIHEKNNNKTSYKTTDVERIEFTQNVTESTSSAYATKQELKDGLDTKADKSEIAALLNRIEALERTLAELEKMMPVSTTAKFEDITLNGKTYKLGVSGAIDLGLSVKWATMNVGASSPSEYGDYYAWGETSTKSEYTWATYFDSVNGSNSVFTKYGFTKKTKLDPEDDVAHVKFGGAWRMPTTAEQDDLRTKCTWVWTQYGGHNGYVVIGTNGNAIFLPAAGFCSSGDADDVGTDGYYWSSSLFDEYESGSYIAYGLRFESTRVRCFDDGRKMGASIRPVCP